MTDSFIKQFYYTSCPIGLSGSPGFQIRAESAGITDAEKQEIIGRSFYKPPLDIPIAPDGIDFSALPPSFKFFTLSTGRLALIGSFYSGKDYSNRSGNYFTHAVIFDPADSPCSAINYIFPIDWKTNLSAEEALLPPDPLPLIPLSSLNTKSTFSRDHLIGFIAKYDNGQRFLSLMIQALFRSQLNSRSLIIKSEINDHNIFWIVCLINSFPPQFHNLFNFSTYQFNPKNCLLINGTLGQTDFTFNENEINYQFYLFDFVSKIHSSFENDSNEIKNLDLVFEKYADTISEWFINDTDKLQQFFNFTALFNLSTFDTRLIMILDFFRQCIGEDILISNETIKFLKTLIKSELSPESLLFLQNFHNNYFFEHLNSSNFEIWNAMFFISFTIASSLNSADMYNNLCNFWIKTLDNFISCDPHILNIISSLRMELEKKYPLAQNTINALLSSDEHIEFLNNISHKLPIDSLLFIFRLLLQSLNHSNNIPLTNKLFFTVINDILQIKENNIETILFALTLLANNSTNLSNLIVLIVIVLDYRYKDHLFSESIFSNNLRLLGYTLFEVFQNNSNQIRSEADDNSDVANTDIFNYNSNDDHITHPLKYATIKNIIAKLSAKYATSEYSQILLFYEWFYTVNKFPNDILAIQEEYDKLFIFERHVSFFTFTDNVIAILSDKFNYNNYFTDICLRWVSENTFALFSNKSISIILEHLADNFSFENDDPRSATILTNIDNILSRFKDESLAEKKLIHTIKSRLSLRRIIDYFLTLNFNYDEYAPEMIRSLDLNSFSVFIDSVLPKLLFNNNCNFVVFSKFLDICFVNSYRNPIISSLEKFLNTRLYSPFNDIDFEIIFFYISLASQNSLQGFLSGCVDPIKEYLAARYWNLSSSNRKKLIYELKYKVVDSPYNRCKSNLNKFIYFSLPDFKPSLLKRFNPFSKLTALQLPTNSIIDAKKRRPR
ncbi:MAG: hypothetical protein LBO66_04085 [Deltaproteobacteria bacterium]|jgi:hypothetical protein|nr:hypothetical protein [Deltaproteobacteria bacterium]